MVEINVIDALVGNYRPSRPAAPGPPVDNSLLWRILNMLGGSMTSGEEEEDFPPERRSLGAAPDLLPSHRSGAPIRYDDFQQTSRMTTPYGGQAEYLTGGRGGGATAERFAGGGTFNQGALTDEWRKPVGSGAADQLLGSAWQAAIAQGQGARGSNESARALAALLQGAGGVAQEGRLERELPLRAAETESLIEHRQAQNKRWDDESLNDRFLRYMDLRRNRGFMDPEPPSFDMFEAEYKTATQKVAPDVVEIQTKDNPLLPRQKEGTVVTETAQEAGQRNLRPTVPISVDGKTYSGYFFEQPDESLKGKGKWKKLSNGWGFVPNSELGL